MHNQYMYLFYTSNVCGAEEDVLISNYFARYYERVFPDDKPCNCFVLIWSILHRICLSSNENVQYLQHAEGLTPLTRANKKNKFDVMSPGECFLYGYIIYM